MGHAHHHHSEKAGSHLLISIFLNLAITLAQAIGGFVSGSLSLLSDALHNLSDVFSLVISYLANKLSSKDASLRRTFGHKRAEIIAAFINAASLILVALFLIKESIERFMDPKPIGSQLVIILSVLGILANGLSVILIKKHSNSNMNLRSAYLHLFTDMLASIAVLTGGILMYFFKAYWIDPLLTVIIAFYLVYMGYDLLKSSVHILMLFTPDNIKIKDVAAEICNLEAVKNMHHIHIWKVNEQEIHLEAHIDLMSDILVSQFEIVLLEIEEILYHKFGINHVNIQPEFAKPDHKQLIVQE